MLFGFFRNGKLQDAILIFCFYLVLSNSVAHEEAAAHSAGIAFLADIISFFGLFILVQAFGEVIVVSVEKGGPADKAGVKEKDIITELDGRSVANMEQLQDTLQYYAAGEKVKITVERADSGKYKEQTLDITLGSAKEQEKEGA